MKWATHIIISLLFPILFWQTALCQTPEAILKQHSNIIDHWVYRDGRWQVTDRFTGGDVVTNVINVAKGFLLGVAVTLLVRWLIRLIKKTKKV